jgi:hypothetical protein
MNKPEKTFEHDDMIVQWAESVLLLIEAGRTPDTIQAAQMLGLPVEYLEHQLQCQTLREFVRKCARGR